MKKVITFFVLMLFIIANNPIYSRSYIPRRTLTASTQVVVGMKYEKVIELLGQPYKKEKVIKDNVEYDVQYFPKGNSVLQTRYIDKNFTPLVFYKDTLQGWGWPYFEAFFEIRKGKIPVQKVSWDRNGQKEVISKIPLEENKIKSGPSEDTQNKKVEQALQNFLQESAPEKQGTSVSAAPVAPKEPSSIKAPSLEPVKQASSATATESSNVAPKETAKQINETSAPVSAIASAAPLAKEPSPEPVKQTAPVVAEKLPAVESVKPLVQLTNNVEVKSKSFEGKDVPVIEILIHSENGKKEPSKIEVKVVGSKETQSILVPANAKAATTQNTSVLKIAKSDEANVNPQLEIRIVICN